MHGPTAAVAPLVAGARTPSTDPAPGFREDERRILDRLLADLAAGRSTVATLTGPPGFGQHGLLRWAARRAPRHGVRVLRAAAARSECRSGYGVVGQLLGQPAEPGGAAVRSRGSSDRSGGLPGLAALVSAVRGLPTLLTVENAQWLDPESLHWLCALVRRSADLPVAVLAGGSGVTATGPDWRSLAAASPGPVAVRELVLARLGPADTAAEVARACGGTGEERFVAAAHAVTDGNPAVLCETLRQFAARGHRPVTARAPELRAVAGRVLGDHVTRVLGGLDEETVAVLRALAVCDDLLDLAAVCRLGRATSLDEARLRAALAATGFVRPRGARLRLDPAARARVLEGMTADERAELHAAAAELAHRAAADDQAVAALLLGARPIRAPWASSVLSRASRAALRQGSRSGPPATWSGRWRRRPNPSGAPGWPWSWPPSSC